jgi:hypothetical protein
MRVCQIAAHTTWLQNVEFPGTIIFVHVCGRLVIQNARISMCMEGIINLHFTVKLNFCHYVI